MAVKNLTLAGKRFVILPAEEYRLLRQRAESRTIRKAGPRKDPELVESLRRLADPSDKIVPYAEARKRLGLA